MSLKTSPKHTPGVVNRKTRTQFLAIEKHLTLFFSKFLLCMLRILDRLQLSLVSCKTAVLLYISKRYLWKTDSQSKTLTCTFDCIHSRLFLTIYTTPFLKYLYLLHGCCKPIHGVQSGNLSVTIFISLSNLSGFSLAVITDNRRGKI